MTEKELRAAASDLVEDAAVCTLQELCVSCNVNPEWVAALVEQGAIEVAGGTRQDWQFATLSVVRVAKAKRLERDLGLNLPGIALALDLLDQLNAMRAQMQALREQPVRPPGR
jgi:chaperone modulatory protein CbpM